MLFTTGDKVTFVTGAFAGREGVVLAYKGGTHKYKVMTGTKKFLVPEKALRPKGPTVTAKRTRSDSVTGIEVGTTLSVYYRGSEMPCIVRQTMALDSGQEAHRVQYLDGGWHDEWVVVPRRLTEKPTTCPVVDPATGQRKKQIRIAARSLPPHKRRRLLPKPQFRGDDRLSEAYLHVASASGGRLDHDAISRVLVGCDVVHQNERYVRVRATQLAATQVETKLQELCKACPKSLVYRFQERRHATAGKYTKGLVTTCVFRACNSYRGDAKYIDGLGRLARDVPAVLPGYKLRVYYDQSVIQESIGKWDALLVELSRLDYVELVEYDFPQFRMKGRPGHEGLFGTMVREWPLFDFPENDGPGLMIGTDADNYRFTREIVERFTASEFQFHTRSKANYQLLNRANFGEHAKRTQLNITASGVLSKVRLPRQMLLDFLLQTLDAGWTEMAAFQAHVQRDPLARWMTHTHSSLFSYGIDEYFFHSRVLTYLMDKKIRMSTHVENDIARVVEKVGAHAQGRSGDEAALREFQKLLMGEEYYDATKSTKALQKQIIDSLKTTVEYTEKIRKLTEGDTLDAYGFEEREIALVGKHFTQCYRFERLLGIAEQDGIWEVVPGG